MPENNKPVDREVSLIITIRINSIPSSQVAQIEEEAFRVGDEYGAQVDINKGVARPVP